MSQLAFIGLWHLGCVTSAGLAKLGHSVAGTDEDASVVANLKKGIPPLYEPGLDELIKEQMKQGRLTFFSRLADILPPAEFVFLSSDTPVNEKDRVDVSGLWRAVKGIAALLPVSKPLTLVIQSQIPVGTCDAIQSFFQKKKHDVRVAYWPENLRLGQALASFFEPDRFAIGAADRATQQRVAGLFEGLPEKPLLTDLRTAEMAKHATNALLAATICFANELSEVCESMDADALMLANILLKDRRFQSKLPLRPGLSFSGGTLARDLRVLKRVGVQTKRPLKLINSILASNDEHHRYVVGRVKKGLSGKKKPTLSVLGLAYKAGTSTLRRSLPLAMVNDLSAWGAKIQAHDPHVNPRDIPKRKGLSFHSNPYDSLKGADAVLFLTEWDEFKRLDFNRAHSLMKTPLAFDLKNMFGNGVLEKSGFRVVRCGVGARS